MVARAHLGSKLLRAPLQGTHPMTSSTGFGEAAVVELAFLAFHHTRHPQ